MKTNVLKLLMATLVTAAVFASCSKKEDVITPKNSTSAAARVGVSPTKQRVMEVTPLYEVVRDDWRFRMLKTTVTCNIQEYSDGTERIISVSVSHGATRLYRSNVNYQFLGDALHKGTYAYSNVAYIAVASKNFMRANEITYNFNASKFEYTGYSVPKGETTKGVWSNISFFKGGDGKIKWRKGH